MDNTPPRLIRDVRPSGTAGPAGPLLIRPAHAFDQRVRSPRCTGISATKPALFLHPKNIRAGSWPALTAVRMGGVKSARTFWVGCLYVYVWVGLGNSLLGGVPQKTHSLKRRHAWSFPEAVGNSRHICDCSASPSFHRQPRKQKNHDPNPGRNNCTTFTPRSRQVLGSWLHGPVFFVSPAPV